MAGRCVSFFQEMGARIISMEAFDTLAFAKKLKNAGYSDVQAEAMAEVQAEVFRGMLDSSLATKTDLKEELGGLRSDLHKMGSGLYRALIAQTVVLIVAMVGIIWAFKYFG